MTDEGLLLYGGRMDFQIKFNGYRIELEDVSQNLNKSRFIESAVAVPRYNKDHKVQNLLAYVILKTVFVSSLSEISILPRPSRKT